MAMELLDATAVTGGVIALATAGLYSAFQATVGKPRPWLRFWVCLSAANAVVGALYGWRSASLPDGLEGVLAAPVVAGVFVLALRLRHGGFRPMAKRHDEKGRPLDRA